MCLMQLSNTYQYLEHENSHKLREPDQLETSKGPQWALQSYSANLLRVIYLYYWLLVFCQR